MNAYINFAPSARQRVPMPLMELISYCDRAVSLAGIRPSAFGLAIGSSASLLADVRAGGRKPRWRLRLRMEDHASALIRDARERALGTLLTVDREATVGEIVEGLIGLMDALDGDPDLESALGDEDAFEHHSRGYDARGPGCLIADPDFGVDDSGLGGGDLTYAEWHTLPAATRRTGRVDGTLIDWRTSRHEDTEEDDGEDVNGDERDGTFAEDEGPCPAVMLQGSDQYPGCPVSDPGGAAIEDQPEGDAW